MDVGTLGLVQALDLVALALELAHRVELPVHPAQSLRLVSRYRVEVVPVDLLTALVAEHLEHRALRRPVVEYEQGLLVKAARIAHQLQFVRQQLHGLVEQRVADRVLALQPQVLTEHALVDVQVGEVRHRVPPCRVRDVGVGVSPGRDVAREVLFERRRAPPALRLGDQLVGLVFRLGPLPHLLGRPVVRHAHVDLDADLVERRCRAEAVLCHALGRHGRRPRRGFSVPVCRCVRVRSGLLGCVQAVRRLLRGVHALLCRKVRLHGAPAAVLSWLHAPALPGHGLQQLHGLLGRQVRRLRVKRHILAPYKPLRHGVRLLHPVPEIALAKDLLAHVVRIPEHILRLRLLPVACQFLPADAVLADVLQLLLHGEFHTRQFVCNADPVCVVRVPDHAQPRVLCPRHQVRLGARRGQKRDCLIKANHALRLGLKVRGRDLLCLLEQLLNLHRRRSVNVVFFRRHPLADAL